MFYVYILYSPSTDQFYKGMTSDYVRRLDRHNKGYEKYTSKGIPWILLWRTSKTTKSEAVILERKLKNLSVDRTIEFMIKYASEVPGSDELLFIQKLSER